jgi:hypothetical protein
MIWALTKELLTSRIGQALIAALVLLVLAWWAYSSVWQRGYDVAAAEGDARLRSMQAQIEAERRASERDARDAESRHRDALIVAAQQYEKDKIDAQAAADRTIADLRSGAVRLRQHWQGCVATSALSGAAATAAVADDGAELRRQDSGDLVRIGEECDAQVRGLQAVALACSAGGVQ